jgi:hypothetical protein
MWKSTIWKSTSKLNAEERLIGIGPRVAQFGGVTELSPPGLPDSSRYMTPKTGKSVPNAYKMYQMVTKYPKCRQNVPNGHLKNQHFPM